ncbi:MAG: box helicase protein, partial [Mycobacterium sp.]|nr:box helicase protein [Mycobacterium sp.]
MRLAAPPSRRDRLTHVEMRPGRDAAVVGWPDWVHPSVVRAAVYRGVAGLWSHQAEAATLAHRGR